MRTQASPKLDPSNVAMRLGMCAAALVGTAGMASQADAAVVTFNTPINVPNNFDGVYINFLTGATGTSAASVPGWDFDPYNSGVSLSFFWNGTPASSSGGVAGTTTGPYLSLAEGSVISSASIFTAVTATAQTVAFQNVDTHFLGFRFFNEGSSAVNYGYATLSTGGSTGFPLTITSWSFENTGAAITIPGAAAVPEPATGALLAISALALGAVNLRRIRRQRKPAR